MTVKSAGGVFLGVLAALLAIESQGWLWHAYQPSKHENAFRITVILTPDIVIHTCGKPGVDVSSRLPDLR
jgi:hypothetical protein